LRFDSYHPLVNFVFFASVLVMAGSFNQPVFLSLSLVTSFVCLFSIRKKTAVVTGIFLLCFTLAYALYYSTFHHFGVTVLRSNVINNQITVEAFVFGMVQGIKISAVILWLRSFMTIFSMDKVVYLLGCILPKLSLFLAITLRYLPLINKRFAEIKVARKCIGRGIEQKNPVKFLKNISQVLAATVNWSLEAMIIISNSMRSRGYQLRKRTAYELFSFGSRDRIMLLVMTLAQTCIWSGHFLDQTRSIYNPEITINQITIFSYLFYTVYAFYCLVPVALQLYNHLRFDYLLAKYDEALMDISDPVLYGKQRY